MQRMILCQQFCRLPRLLSATSGLSHRTAAQQLTFRQISTGLPRLGPNAAEIKKNVPELWVRKMKTFFAFSDKNCDGVVNGEDYEIFEEACVSLAGNANKEKIEKFRTKMRELWIDQITEGEDNWTENKYLERIFEVVNRPGAEEFFRQAAGELFNLLDLNGDGFISKDEAKVMLGGDTWSIVAFSAMDINRNGVISKDEFVQTYVDFWFNFADETNPSKHFVGPLVNI